MRSCRACWSRTSMRAGLPDTDEGLREVQEQGLLARAQVPKATSAQVIFHDEGCDAREENTQGQGGLRGAGGKGEDSLGWGEWPSPAAGRGPSTAFSALRVALLGFAHRSR